MKELNKKGGFLLYGEIIENLSLYVKSKERISLRGEKGMSSKRLKEVRKSLGLTQAQIAEKINEQWSKIKDIETGKQKISIEVAIKISEIFSINGWWLLTGNGQMLKSEDGEVLAEDEKEVVESYRKLQPERKKFYYFKIVAEAME